MKANFSFYFSKENVPSYARYPINQVNFSYLQPVPRENKVLANLQRKEVTLNLS
jgi:hypothetical protein